jgi:hypothetical protein
MGLSRTEKDWIEYRPAQFRYMIFIGFFLKSFNPAAAFFKRGFFDFLP